MPALKVWVHLMLHRQGMSVLCSQIGSLDWVLEKISFLSWVCCCLQLNAPGKLGFFDYNLCPLDVLKVLCTVLYSQSVYSDNELWPSWHAIQLLMPHSLPFLSD